MSVQWQQGKFRLCANCFICWVAVVNPRLQDLRQKTPPTAVLSILTTRPLPIREKRIASSHIVSYIQHNSEPILARKIHHLALTPGTRLLIYHFFCVNDT